MTETQAPVVHFPTEEEGRAHLAETLREMRHRSQQHKLAAIVALQAMDRLAQVLTHRSGQPYKLRALLYSLYNGKPASLLDVVSLDWEIRQDLCAVLNGFGYERGEVKCFYDALKTAISKAGQWNWFITEHESNEKLRDHLEGCGYTVTPSNV